MSERGYTLQLFAPTAPAGPVTLAFRVLGRDARPVTAYEVTHERELHPIVVQRDLSDYRHVHPARDAEGTWTARADLRSGPYRVFADFQPAGEPEALTLGADLLVSSSMRPGLLPQPAREVRVDGYTVTMAGGLVPGATSRLSFAVTRDGRPVTDLQPYLGAAGHLVVLRAGDLAYLHVHPAGDELAFDVEVPSPGTYRLYLEFQHGGAGRVRRRISPVNPIDKPETSEGAMRQRPTVRSPASRRVANVQDPPTSGPALRVQILATEHWSLLATRSMLWSEAFTRVTIFLTVVSATVVALALVAQAAGTDSHFLTFALLLLPIVLFLGLATYVRLGANDIEDTRLVAGMNRLRRGYLQLAPDLEPHFLTGSHDDEAGVMQTLGSEAEIPRSFMLQVLTSSHGVVGVVDGCLAGVVVALLARAFGAPTVLAIVLAVIAGLILLAVLVANHVGQMRRLERIWVPRFPAAGSRAGPEASDLGA